MAGLISDSLCSESFCSDTFYSDSLSSDRLLSGRVFSESLHSERLSSESLHSESWFSNSLSSKSSFPKSSFSKSLLSESLWDRRSVFVVCLRPGARPSPLCDSSHQARSYWILFNVANHCPQLFGRTNPVIVRFVLPKRHPRATQNLICGAAGSSFEPSHDGMQFADRLPYHVNMIGHNHPCMQSVKLTNCFAVQQSMGKHARHPRVHEPLRTAWIVRLRTGESPGYEENRVIRNPVRGVSAVEAHCFLIRKRQTTENRWSVLRELVADLGGCSL